MKFPPWPNYSEKEAEIAREVLLSNQVNYWTGQRTKQFEQQFATQFETQHGIALSNGTVALDLALKALNIGPGDEVVVTPRSFIASASSVVMAGAKAVFADVDPVSQNITAETIAAVITPKTQAIQCVHLAGWPCNMEDILALANEHNLTVIEDCAQAHGARYNGRSVGSFGDIGAWSFCQDKIMTTAGEGGMITTNNKALFDFMWAYKDHGKDFTKVHTPNSSTTFRYIHDSIGTNWRLTELQSAIGSYQLEQLADWSQSRKRNGAWLCNALGNIDGLRITIPGSAEDHAYYKYYFFVDPDKLAAGYSRDRIVAEITASGVPCFTGSCPEIYKEKAFTSLYGETAPLPVAEMLGQTSVLVNVHPGIEEEHLQHYVEVIQSVMLKAVL